MGALTTAMVPLEHPRFPRVGAQRLEEELFAHFPIEDARDFGSFRKGLMVFDDIALFPTRLATLVDDERDAGSDEAAIAAAVEQDRGAFAGFPLAEHFTELSLSDRRAYLRLWATSGFTLRRRFYRSAKSLVMIAAYSMPEVWSVIGYEGPLLGRE